MTQSLMVFEEGINRYLAKVCTSLCSSSCMQISSQCSFLDLGQRPWMMENSGLLTSLQNPRFISWSVFLLPALEVLKRKLSKKNKVVWYCLRSIPDSAYSAWTFPLSDTVASSKRSTSWPRDESIRRHKVHEWSMTFRPVFVIQRIQQLVPSLSNSQGRVSSAISHQWTLAVGFADCWGWDTSHAWRFSTWWNSQKINKNTTSDRFQIQSSQMIKCTHWSLN